MQSLARQLRHRRGMAAQHLQMVAPPACKGTAANRGTQDSMHRAQCKPWS